MGDLNRFSTIRFLAIGLTIILNFACSHTAKYSSSIHDDAITAMIVSMGAPSNYQSYLHGQLDLEKSVYPQLAPVLDDIKNQFDLSTTTRLLVPIYKQYFSVEDARDAERYFKSELGNKMTNLLEANMNKSQIENELTQQELAKELSFAKMRFKDPGVWLNISADFDIAASLTIQNMLSNYVKTRL